MTNVSPGTCLVTGGHGYLGGELVNYLRKAGWRVLLTSRSPREKQDIPYSLGGDFPPGALHGIDALVHAAYDFGPSDWKGIHEKNVLGTQRLLGQAREAGIRTLISVSSISAFPECQSLYGKAKLLIEEATLAAGGMVLRPGLIYGGNDQGMYGRLVKQVDSQKPIPLLVGSSCTQYLVHVEDLSRLIENLLSGNSEKPTQVWTVAHSEPWPLRKLLVAIADARGLKARFLPVPWQAVWTGLRLAEMAGLKLAFKSDSVRSIVHQNPRPDFGPVLAAGVNLRAFTPSFSSPAGTSTKSSA